LTFWISSPVEVCNMPVAKRNFLLRHGHGMFQTSKELKEEVDEVCDSLLKEKMCIPCEPTVSPKYHRRVVSFESWKRKEEKPLDGKEREWLELLHQRPNDDEEIKMSLWLGKVRHVSGVKRDEMKQSTLASKKKIGTRHNGQNDTSDNVTKKDFTSWISGDAPDICVTDVCEYESLFGDVDIENFFGINQNGYGLEVQK
jgi:hypothetical protein